MTQWIAAANGYLININHIVKVQAAEGKVLASLTDGSRISLMQPLSAGTLTEFYGGFVHGLKHGETA